MKDLFYMVLQERLMLNVRKILTDRGLIQSYISTHSDFSESKVSKIMTLEQRMTVEDLAVFAKVFSLREIDLFTYPDIYIPREAPEEAPVEAVLQIRLTKDKKDQVMKLVFGENNIEILNL